VAAGISVSYHLKNLNLNRTQLNTEGAIKIFENLPLGLEELDLSNN